MKKLTIVESPHRQANSCLFPLLSSPRQCETREMASMASQSLAVPAATRAASRRARGTASRLRGNTRGFGAHETQHRFSNVRASGPRRRTDSRAAVSAVAGLFGRGASPDTASLSAIEAEIGSGQLEELVAQAKDELGLIPKMAEWKPWVFDHTIKIHDEEAPAKEEEK